MTLSLDDIIKLNKRGRSARGRAGRGRGRRASQQQASSGSVARPGGLAQQQKASKESGTWRGQGDGKQQRKRGKKQKGVKQLLAGGNQQKGVKQLLTSTGGNQQGGRNRRKAQQLRVKARRTLQGKPPLQANTLQQDTPKSLSVKQRLGVRVNPGNSTGAPAGNRPGSKVRALR